MGFSKILWIEGIHRIPVGKAVSLEAINPAFTLILAYFILHEIPTKWQIFGFLPIFIGVLFVTDFSLKSKKSLDKKEILG